MPSSEPVGGIDLGDRIYLIARISMTTPLLLLYATGYLSFSGEPDSTLRLVFLAGLALIIGGGAFTVLSHLIRARTSERVMWETLPVDLAGASMLIWSTGGYQDPIYPWMLGLTVAYSALMGQRRAWAISGIVSVTYMLAHAAGHAAMQEGADIVLLAFKAGALFFTGYVVANVMRARKDRDESLLQGVANVESLNEQLSRRLAELHAISEITEIIHSTLDFDQVGPLVLDILSKVIGLPSSCLFVIDKDKDETVFSASSGLTAAAAQAFREDALYGPEKILQNPDSASDLFACTTVLDHKRLMVVFCATGDWLSHLVSEDRLVLQAVASELVVAVENSQLYKLTKRLSVTDELTGLFNYRYLQQRLEDEIERARRYSRSIALLMLDADDFKLFNDTHGHIAGDRALEEIGIVLRRAVREIDVVCRYGGEEFSVILPETDAEGAYVVAEKVREAIAVHRFADANGEREVRLTVSIGLATYPGSASDREELLRQADDALYQAKNFGRDRVRAPLHPHPRVSEEDETAAIDSKGA